MAERRHLYDVPMVVFLLVALVVGVIGWTVTWYAMVGLFELLRWLLM